MREQQTPRDSGSESSGGRFGYRLNAQQRIRNAIRVPQAVVKIVRGGGAGSACDLASQLTYLSRGGELALDEYDPDGSSFDLQGTSEIKGLSHNWASRWNEAEALDGRAARSKFKTYHLIVSFPEGTDDERAHDAANTFADKFLTSGEFGDRWSHIRALHTDRAHPHMHIVIDRRGESGVMMQINPARDISPARLRGLQVDAAAEHGLLLNDTPRVSRGLTHQGLSSAEWRAEQRGQRIGRSPHRLAYENLAAGFADEIIRHEAAELRRLARTLEAGRTLAPDTNHQQLRFITALDGAAMALEHGKDLSPMEPQTLEGDRTTLDALSAMSVDDLSWSEAEYQVVDLHDYAVGTYRATTRAISCGVSLDATEIYAPKDPFFERARYADIDPEREISGLPPEQDMVVERDRDDPLVIVERDEPLDNERPSKSADDPSSKDEDRNPARDAVPEKTRETDRAAKPSHEEFMRMTEEQERALLKDEANETRERGRDRSQDIDDGFGF